jgi:membrane protease YdiL (CAAX protease family)
LLQTRLERRHNVFVAALITIVPFTLVHEPLRLFVGDVTPVSVAAGLGLYMMLGLFFRPMLAVVLRGTRDSVVSVVFRSRLTRAYRAELDAVPVEHINATTSFR